jgi:hypothetical protein
MLGQNERVPFVQTETGVTLTLPAGHESEPDRVVVLALRR